jgi:RNase P/RNase MRP subunit p30
MERVFLSEKNFSRLKEFVKKNKGKEIVFSSEDDDLNRKVIEKLDIQILLVNLEGRKDFMKQRNSGFNQVMAKVMKKKGITLGINLDELVLSKRKDLILARLRQNIFLCTKNKVNMKFIGFKVEKNLHDLKSLGLVLGMPTWMVKSL